MAYEIYIWASPTARQHHAVPFDRDQIFIMFILIPAVYYRPERGEHGEPSSLKLAQGGTNHIFFCQADPLCSRGWFTHKEGRWYSCHLPHLGGGKWSFGPLPVEAAEGMHWFTAPFGLPFHTSSQLMPSIIWPLPPLSAAAQLGPCSFWLTFDFRDPLTAWLAFQTSGPGI